MQRVIITYSTIGLITVSAILGRQSVSKTGVLIRPTLSPLPFPYLSPFPPVFFLHSLPSLPLPIIICRSSPLYGDARQPDEGSARSSPTGVGARLKCTIIDLKVLGPQKFPDDGQVLLMKGLEYLYRCM
jgi:hypothetical protein